MSRPGWIGLDAGHEDVRAAEHAASALADALGCADEVCTHALAGPRPHYAASLRIPAGAWAPRSVEDMRALVEGAMVYEGGDWALEVGEAADRDRARVAAASHAAGEGGRAIRFAGQAALRGTVSVEDMLAASAISDVQVLGTTLGAGSVIETNDHVRPQYSGGRLTLVVTPLEDGRLQPFEIEHAHQCCGGH